MSRFEEMPHDQESDGDGGHAAEQHLAQWSARVNLVVGVAAESHHG